MKRFFFFWTVLPILISSWTTHAFAEAAPLSSEPPFLFKLSIFQNSFNKITDCPIDLAIRSMRSITPNSDFKDLATLSEKKNEILTTLAAGRYLLRATEACDKTTSLITLPNFRKKDIPDIEFYAAPAGSLALLLGESCKEKSGRCFTQESETKSVFASVDFRIYLKTENEKNLIDYQVISQDGSEKYTGSFDSRDIFSPVLNRDKKYSFRFRESQSSTPWMEIRLGHGQSKLINLQRKTPEFKLTTDEGLASIPGGITYTIMNETNGDKVAQGALQEPIDGIHTVKTDSPMYVSDVSSAKFKLTLSYRHPKNGDKKSISIDVTDSLTQPIPDLLGLPVLSIPKSIYRSLERNELQYLEGIYKISEMDSRQVFGIVTSVQTVNRSSPGSTQAGDFFHQNQMAQQFDRNFDSIRQGGRGMSATEMQIYGAFTSLLGSQLNEKPEAKFIHRYQIKTPDETLQSVDVVSQEEFYIPVGTCVSVTNGNSVGKENIDLCKKPSIDEFKEKYLSSFYALPETRKKSNSSEPISSESLISCKVKNNPVIKIPASTCISIGGTPQSTLKCKFGSNTPIVLNASKCLQAKGELVSSP